MTRRDKCELVGRRAENLNAAQAAVAWWQLSEELRELGDRDVPKFKDLLRAIRKATIKGRGPDDHLLYEPRSTAQE